MLMEIMIALGLESALRLEVGATALIETPAAVDFTTVSVDSALVSVRTRLITWNFVGVTKRAFSAV